VRSLKYFALVWLLALADTACGPLGTAASLYSLMWRNASCGYWNSTRLTEWLIRIAAPLPHL